MLKKFIANYAAYRVARVLYDLTDKQLADVGLTRANLIQELKVRLSQ